MKNQRTVNLKFNEEVASQLMHIAADAETPRGGASAGAKTLIEVVLDDKEMLEKVKRILKERKQVYALN